MIAAWVGSGAGRFCRYHGSVDWGDWGDWASSEGFAGVIALDGRDSVDVAVASVADCESTALSASADDCDGSEIISLAVSSSSRKANSGSLVAGSSRSAARRAVELIVRWGEHVEGAKAARNVDAPTRDAPRTIGLEHETHLSDDDTALDKDMMMLLVQCAGASPAGRINSCDNFWSAQANADTA